MDGEVSNIDISKALTITGWMKPAELRWLAVRASKCERVLEIGSYHGRSTVAMLENSNARIWCVDSWDTDAVFESDYVRFVENLEPYSNRITVLRGEGERMLSDLRIAGEQFDMAFVDDGHDYELVHADILNCLPLVRDDGLLCGHDYNPAWPGVMKAVNELVPGFNRVKGTSLWWKII